MKHAGIWALLGAWTLLAAAGAVRAETVYVTDTMRFSVRAEPDNDKKSMGVVESGQALELLKAGETWSLVQLPSGVQGYLQSRYLTAQPPARHRFDQLQEKQKIAQAQAAELQEENARLRAEVEKASASVAGAQKELEQVRREFDDFKRGAAEYSALKAGHDALRAELDQKNRQIAALEHETANPFREANLYWFLAGAGVLLVGLVTGLSLKRQRRWSSLS
jgi:SH3 domain protein